MVKPIYLRWYFWVVVIFCWLIVFLFIKPFETQKDNILAEQESTSDESTSLAETILQLSETTTEHPETTINIETTTTVETTTKPPETTTTTVAAATKPPETTTTTVPVTTAQPPAPETTTAKAPETTTKLPETTTAKSPYADLIGNVVFWAPTGNKVHLDPKCRSFNKEGDLLLR